VIDDHDVRPFLERVASEAGSPTVDVRSVERRARRRLAGTLVALALVVIVLIPIGGAAVRNVLRSDHGKPAAPTPTAPLPTHTQGHGALHFPTTGVVVIDPASVDVPGSSADVLGMPGIEKGSVEPERSPDGQQLAFVRREGPGRAQIYIQDANGEIRQLTHLRIGVADPAWSPDGRQIAFSAGSDSSFAPSGLEADIFVIDEDGSDLRRVAATPSPDLKPDWSPDGRRIVFNTYGTEATAGIWVVSLADGAQSRLTDNGVLDGDSGPAWSPDGRWIAFLRYENAPGNNLLADDSDLWLMRPDGSNAHALFTDETKPTKVDWGSSTADGSWQGPPTWSPDGNRIAFETERLVYVVDVRHPELELIANGDFSGLSWDEGGIVASVR